MEEIKAPTLWRKKCGCLHVFLAGSIEMGSAVDWQKTVIENLAGVESCLRILNPRRDDWDKTWGQSISNQQFCEQVMWELTALDNADIILMYFDPATKSPITLLELGLYATSGKLIVCCPDGYWRKGNVDIVCEKHNVKQVATLEEMIDRLKLRLMEVKEE